MGNCSACCPDTTILGDLATDNFCGNILLPCGTQNEVIWQLDNSFFTAGAQTAGTVSVFYDVGCDDLLTVTITDRLGGIRVVEIPPGNTRSYSLLNIVKVDITCNGETGTICRAKYCIDLHYDVLVAPGNN